jgi:hypothetical protein
MTGKRNSHQYVVCVRNDGFRASLVVRRIYKSLPDPVAAKRKLVRVIDESGEDYLYPQTLFTVIELPAAVKKAFAAP